MSLKLYFLYSHLDFFPPENMAAIANEHVERFQKDIS